MDEEEQSRWRDGVIVGEVGGGRCSVEPLLVGDLFDLYLISTYNVGRSPCSVCCSCHLNGVLVEKWISVAVCKCFGVVK